METQGMAMPGASWQRMAVWLARTGYSDLEYSTVMTVRRLALAFREADATPRAVITVEPPAAIVPFVALTAAAD